MASAVKYKIVLVRLKLKIPAENGKISKSILA